MKASPYCSICDRKGTARSKYRHMVCVGCEGEMMACSKCVGYYHPLPNNLAKRTCLICEDGQKKFILPITTAYTNY